MQNHDRRPFSLSRRLVSLHDLGFNSGAVLVARGDHLGARGSDSLAAAVNLVEPSRASFFEVRQPLSGVQERCLGPIYCFHVFERKGLELSLRGFGSINLVL